MANCPDESHGHALVSGSANHVLRAFRALDVYVKRDDDVRIEP